MRIHPTIDIFIAQRLLLVSSDECWIYPSRPSSTGYGHYKFEKKETGAHRAAFVAMYGDTSQLVLHSCDNRGCANPFHLSAGTYKDNYADARSRNRNCMGERNGCAKLNAEQVLAIRSDNRQLAAIANDYGIQLSTVSKIKRRNLWGHVA